MADISSEVPPGFARCPGVSWDDLMAIDTRPVPGFIAEDHYEYLGSEPIDTARYTSAEFFRLENKKLWPQVWQFAAREEELPDPGDYVLYENAGRSYLVVRQDDNSVRAFHNVCLHRGRKLRTESGAAADFKCPFHAFSWNTDGTLKNIPCRWDFPHLQDDAMALPQASVAQWQGYIFIREAAEGPSIEAFLAPMPEHFKDWHLEECSTAIWVAKVVDANWKTTAEAFMEAWHTIETHPQLMDYLGDANTRYNVYSDHVNLALTPYIINSPHIPAGMLSEQEISDIHAQRTGMDQVPGYRRVVVPSGQTARQATAEYYRELYGSNSGRDYSQISDTELVDLFTYNVFPNFSPWGGRSLNIVYRWRPWPDQDHCLMELRILARAPKGEKPARAVPMHLLSAEENWADAPELGGLGGIIDQDMFNLPFVQEGMKASVTGKLQLGNYQEVRVRHFARTLDKYMAR